MAEAIRCAGATADATSQSGVGSQVTKPAVARCDRMDWLSFAVTTLIALLVYLFTLAPNVSLEDSGILSVGAMYSGVPSPPGYPAWTIYSWLFVKLLPFSNIAWRVAVGSAVATAVACGLVARMVSHCGPVLLSNSPAFVRLGPIEQKWLRGVCGGGAGLVLAFSQVVWENAVVAEIWALSLLFFVGVLALVTRWIFDPTRRWRLFAGFFFYGLLLTSSQEMIVALPGLVGVVMLSDRKLGRDLALTLLPLAVIATLGNQWGLWVIFPARLNWPIMMAFVFVFALGIVVAVRTHRVGLEWKPALLCCAGLLLGLALYLYVPLASMTNPPVNWGYPRTAEGFFHVLARGQFERVLPTSGFCIFVGQLCTYGEITAKKVGWPCVTFAALSLCSLPRMSRVRRCSMLGLLVVWICVGPVMVAELNPPPDRQAQELIGLYFATSHAILALLAGVGMTWLGATLSRTDNKQPVQVSLRAE